MDDWLIFQYHFICDKAESEVLREPLRGLPTHSVLGQRWGDAGGYVDPGDGCPGASVREGHVGKSARSTPRHDAEPF